MMQARIIYLSETQSVTSLIDNAYHLLTSQEASALIRIAAESSEPMKETIAYLHNLGIAVQINKDGL